MFSRRLSACLFSVTVMFGSVGAGASVFVPTRLDDVTPDGCAVNGCTLREAVIAANANPGPDTIELNAIGTYQLSIAGIGEDAAATGDLDITGPLEIGPPAGVHTDAATFVVNGGGLDRVFHVLAISGEQVVLHGLTITGGSAVTPFSGFNRYGGGLLAYSGLATGGETTVVGCIVTGNQALSGGGLMVEYPSSLRVRDTTVADNHAVTAGASAGFVGGIQGRNGAPLVVINSTIVGNSSTGEAGGVAGANRIEHSTIADNAASAASAIHYDVKPTTVLVNNVISGSCGPDGILTSLGGNVESPGDTCHLGSNDSKNVSPASLDLQPLADHGGPTPTRALGPNSVAHNAIYGGSCQVLDQRGFPRRSRTDPRCDAGASEQLPFCRAPGLAIPDNTPAGVSDPLIVADTLPINDLDLYLNVTHTWVGDLKVQLTRTGAGAALALLVDRPGLPVISATGCADDDMRLVLDDEAGPTAESSCFNTSVPAASAYPYVAVRPGDPAASLLTSFEGGISVQGTWTLGVSDHAAGDAGTLVEWCLVPTGDFLSDGFEIGSGAAWSALSP
jgi:CSLREA domain-containing protein